MTSVQKLSRIVLICRQAERLAEFYIRAFGFACIEDSPKIDPGFAELALYDELGFYAYHLAEHHSTPLGMSPSPSVFLSAVIQRTWRLRIGPLVYLLPL